MPFVAVDGCSIVDRLFPGRSCHYRREEALASCHPFYPNTLITTFTEELLQHYLAIARRPFAQAMAQQMGASETIPMDDHWQIIEKVKELTNDDLCPVVLECVGKQWPLDLAAELTGVRGRLVVAGYHQDGLRQVNMQQWNWRGFDVINAHERDPAVYVRGVERASRLVAERIIDLDPLLTNEFTLDKIGDALQFTADRPDGFFKAWINLQ